MTSIKFTPQDFEHLRALSPEEKEALKARLTKVLADSERSEAESRERWRVFTEEQRLEAEAHKAEIEAAEAAREIIERGKAKAAAIRKGARP
jgi:hypothetical protein